MLIRYAQVGMGEQLALVLYLFLRPGFPTHFQKAEMVTSLQCSGIHDLPVEWEFASTGLLGPWQVSWADRKTSCVPTDSLELSLPPPSQLPRNPAA